MRVLVTGHNGYIGSVMLPVLNAAGHTLTGVDTLFFEACTLTAAAPAPVFALRRDIRDVRVEDLEGHDAVIHLAAVDDALHGTQSAETIAEINHRGAVQLAERARAAGVSRFLYASSCNVYGGGHGTEALTEDAALRPVTRGATAKARAEDEITPLADATFSPVIMRNATAYGVSPRLRADLLLNNLVCWAHTTGRIRVTGPAALWQPLIHVEDIAYAFAAALTAPRTAIHAQTFNVGSDTENYQLAELVDLTLAAVPGSRVDYVLHPEDTPCTSRVNFGKLSRTFPDFRPRWNAAFGAKDLYAALQEAGVTHEQAQGRYSRAVTLRSLIEAGHLDVHLRSLASTARG